MLHSTCSSSGWLISPLPVAPQVLSSSDSGETPSGSLLRRRQLTGLPPKKVIWPMSPLVGLPKKPLLGERVFEDLVAPVVVEAAEAERAGLGCRPGSGRPAAACRCPGRAPAARPRRRCGRTGCPSPCRSVRRRSTTPVPTGPAPADAGPGHVRVVVVVDVVVHEDPARDRVGDRAACRRPGSGRPAARGRRRCSGCWCRSRPCCGRTRSS